MVYDANTYELLHELNLDAKEKYQKILEDAASEILYKAQHPIKWFLNKALNKIYAIFYYFR